MPGHWPRMTTQPAAMSSTAVVQLLEIVLGIFLGALAIQLAINGLADLGIITLSAH